ncbi:MAG: hypothetical protein KKB59_10300 [Spirochaetes bacterium]|nr:hypothetical protein [Spirochaetota bacterium]
MKTEKNGDKIVSVRMPEQMYLTLTKDAEDQERSLAQEIQFVLKLGWAARARELDVIDAAGDYIDTGRGAREPLHLVAEKTGAYTPKDDGKTD